MFVYDVSRHTSPLFWQANHVNKTLMQPGATSSTPAENSDNVIHLVVDSVLAWTRAVQYCPAHGRTADILADSVLEICLSVVGQDDQSLAGQLQEGCPSYFKEDDKIYYAANAELRRAQTLQGTARQDVTRAALEKLVRVSLHTQGSTVAAKLPSTALRISNAKLETCAAPAADANVSSVNTQA